MHGELHGHHWNALRVLLPVYQAITTVDVGDGATTSLWYDIWHEEDCLAERFPALLTHCKTSNLTVQRTAWAGVRQHLVPRLTPMAREELLALEGILARTSFTEEPDARLSPLLLPNGKLQYSLLYQRLTRPQGAADAVAEFVWGSAALPHVQFFGWLLSRDKIQSKTNLKAKTIILDATCELCDAAEETTQHIIFECPPARSFWVSLGFRIPAGHRVADLHLLPRPPAVQANHYSSFILLCCWHLWKRRNNNVFRQETISPSRLLQLCRDDALPKASRHVATQWCSVLSALIDM
jgi:hypothetical protein